MRIGLVNQTNFSAGSVNIKNFNKKNLSSYNAIKKIAEDKDINLFISQDCISKINSDNYIYTIIAEKFMPKLLWKEIIHTYTKRYFGIDYAVINKSAPSEEFSVKIYNSAIKAMEQLERNMHS